MRVTPLGTGDTTGIPPVGCDCDACERARSEGIEGTVFRSPSATMAGADTLVDCSPDFRQWFLRGAVLDALTARAFAGTSRFRSELGIRHRIANSRSPPPAT